jgi:hypothetical protein
MNQTVTWKADPLTWGHGQRVFEMFLEPTCPFSARAFGKIDETLKLAGDDRVTVKIRLQSQPWHMYSGVIVRCILAASTLQGGKEAAKTVIAAVAGHREEFEFTHHCSGPNMEARPETLSHASRATAAYLWRALSRFRTWTRKSNGTVSTRARTASICRRLL